MTAAEHASEASELLERLDPGNPDRHFWVALASAHALTALAVEHRSALVRVVADLAHARRVKKQLVERYESTAEVNGVGLVRWDDGWAVKVNLERAAPNLSVPESVDGVAVFVDVVGPISSR